jgi:hypothetical protein
MNNQVHKRLSNEQVKAILEKYYLKEMKADQAQSLLGLKRRQFFEWAKRYKKGPKQFSIKSKRTNAHRKITSGIEKIILKELKKDKGLIKNRDIPIRYYNYSYIQKRLKEKNKLTVSTPTIINRAKKHGFYIPRKKRKKKHDREVITNYAGELVQHDTSHHLFAPYAEKKWYLITSIDDYSRFMLYGNLFERESRWHHIEAAEYVFLRRGLPLKYYVDRHSIFKSIKTKEGLYYKYEHDQNEGDPQWRQVLRDLKVGVIYALSPQAKGKVERPYGWLQDHLVRTCAREGVKKIKEGREILKKEINRYNYHQVHSTTQEVPIIRLENALKQNKSLFKPFKLPSPYQSSKDIFCLRFQRKTDGYRKISFEGIKLRVPVDPYQPVDLKLVPNPKRALTEVRIWHKMKLVGTHTIKNSDFKTPLF